MENKMWLIWKQPKSRRRYKIGTLSYLDNSYKFCYVNPELDEAQKDGFKYFPGFDDINNVYESDELFANIATRLPNVSRSDYLEILNLYNLDKTSSKFDILRATRGRLLTDNYEFVPVFNPNKVEFDVAGTRHCFNTKENYELIKENDKLLLELEPDNQYDKNAIKVILCKNNKKYKLGYVPRYYASELTSILKNNVKYSALVKGLNFNSEISSEDITVFVKIIINN